MFALPGNLSGQADNLGSALYQAVVGERLGGAFFAFAQGVQTAAQLTHRFCLGTELSDKLLYSFKTVMIGIKRGPSAGQPMKKGAVSRGTSVNMFEYSATSKGPHTGPGTFSMECIRSAEKQRA